MPKTGARKSSKQMTLEQRRAFMKLPIKDRRQRMAKQAERMVEYYKSAKKTAQRQAWQGGDIGQCQ